MSAYLDELIAACDDLERKIVAAQEACAAALRCLKEARQEIAPPEDKCQHGFYRCRCGGVLWAGSHHNTVLNTHEHCS